MVLKKNIGVWLIWMLILMRVKYFGNVKFMFVMKVNVWKNMCCSKFVIVLNIDLLYKIIFKIDLRGLEFVDLY